MWRNEQSVVETVPQACATLVESFSHKILTRHKIYEKLFEKRLKPSSEIVAHKMKSVLL